MGVEKGDVGEPSLGVTLNLNLTLNQRIWLLFLVPTALHCAVYIADVATDIALVERHYAEARYLQAGLTLILIYSPAVVFLTLTLADKRRWPPEDKGSSQRATWVLKQLGLAVLFPIHAMHR